MEFPSAVFIKALKVDLFCRDLKTLIYTKNKKKKSKEKTQLQAVLSIWFCLPILLSHIPEKSLLKKAEI